MNTYECNECGTETIFSSGLCSDCQLWAGRWIPDIATDFWAIVHADSNQPKSEGSEGAGR